MSTLSALFAIASALVLWAATPALAGTFDDELDKAIAAKKAGDLEKSLFHLRQAYQARPEPQVMNNIGKALEELGRYREAVEAYKKVVDDPKADANLRALDAGRVSVLQGKLGKSWVVVRLPKGAKLFVDGQPPTAPPGQEMGVFPGEHLYEVVLGEGRVYAVVKKFPLDKRTQVNLAPGTDAGTLDMAGVAGVRKVAVRERWLNTPVESIEELLVPAGEVELKLRPDSGPESSLTVSVAAGKRTAAAGPFREALGVTSVVKKDPIPTTESGGAGPMPWVVFGGGVLLVGGGVVLQFVAEGDRDTVRDAARDDNGVITGITSTEAHELQDSANTQSTVAAVMMGVGGAAMVGGLVWALVGGGGDTETEGSVDQVSVAPAPGGLLLKF